MYIGAGDLTRGTGLHGAQEGEKRNTERQQVVHI
jgi:hypothetical protein